MSIYISLLSQLCGFSSIDRCNKSVDSSKKDISVSTDTPETFAYRVLDADVAYADGVEVVVQSVLRIVDELEERHVLCLKETVSYCVERAVALSLDVVGFLIVTLAENDVHIDLDRVIITGSHVCRTIEICFRNVDREEFVDIFFFEYFQFFIFADAFKQFVYFGLHCFG